MASFSSSSSSSSYVSWRIFSICFLAFVLFGSCLASRPMVEKKGSVTEMETAVTTLTPLEELLKIYQEKMKLRRGMVFHVLPKGTPLPPSGPSKRHNSVGN